MENKQDIGKAFRDKLDGLQRQPGDAVWNNINASLQQNKRGGFTMPFWGKATAIVLCIIVLAVVTHPLYTDYLPEIIIKMPADKQQGVTDNNAAANANGNPDSNAPHDTNSDTDNTGTTNSKPTGTQNSEGVVTNADDAVTENANINRTTSSQTDAGTSNTRKSNSSAASNNNNDNAFKANASATANAKAVEANSNRANSKAADNNNNNNAIAKAKSRDVSDAKAKVATADKSITTTKDNNSISKASHSKINGNTAKSNASAVAGSDSNRTNAKAVDNSKNNTAINKSNVSGGGMAPNSGTAQKTAASKNNAATATPLNTGATNNTVLTTGVATNSGAASNTGVTATTGKTSDNNNATETTDNTTLATNAANSKTTAATGPSGVTVADSLSLAQKSPEEKKNERTFADTAYTPPTDSLTGGDGYRNDFYVFAYVSPSNYKFGESTSLVDPSLNNHGTSAETSTNFGAYLGYEFSSQFTLRAGISSTKIVQNTGNVTLGANYTGVDYAGGMSNTAANIALGGTAVNLRQKTSFIEVPVEATYALFGTRADLYFKGGFSTLFLQDNELHATNSQGSVLLGSLNTAKDFSVSANLGFGFYYKFTRELQLNVEPGVKYYINAFDNVSPWSLSVQAGLLYRF